MLVVCLVCVGVYGVHEWGVCCVSMSMCGVCVVCMGVCQYVCMECEWCMVYGVCECMGVYGVCV